MSKNGQFTKNGNSRSRFLCLYHIKCGIGYAFDESAAASDEGSVSDEGSTGTSPGV